MTLDSFEASPDVALVTMSSIVRPRGDASGLFCVALVEFMVDAVSGLLAGLGLVPEPQACLLG